MTEALQQLKADLLAHSIVIVAPGGEFTLSSGAKSRVYCDLKQTAHRASCMDNLAQVLMDRIPEDARPTAFAGVALGGCHLASLLAIKMKKDVIYVRKEPKGHGTQKFIEAPELGPEPRIILLEDVTTTADSARKALRALQMESYNVVATITVVDRRVGHGLETHIEGVPLLSCVNLYDLVDKDLR